MVMLDGSRPETQDLDNGPRLFLQHILSHPMIVQFKVQRTSDASATTSGKKKKTTTREVNLEDVEDVGAETLEILTVDGEANEIITALL